jgi:hypothetical protein
MGQFPMIKRGWGVTLTTAEVKNEQNLYTSHPWRLHGGCRTALFTLLPFTETALTNKSLLWRPVIFLARKSLQFNL